MSQQKSSTSEAESKPSTDKTKKYSPFLTKKKKKKRSHSQTCSPLSSRKSSSFLSDMVSSFLDDKEKDKDRDDEPATKKELPMKAALTFLQSKVSKYSLMFSCALQSVRFQTFLGLFLHRDRNRFVNDQFNLDLTYITPRIIGLTTPLTTQRSEESSCSQPFFSSFFAAMAMPGEGLQSAFRNSLDDVAGMLETEHGKNYMVYNLSEKEYDTSKLNDQVLDFGWPDHQAPPFKILFALCKSIDSWLKSEPTNVVAIHCKVC